MPTLGAEPELILPYFYGYNELEQLLKTSMPMQETPHESCPKCGAATAIPPCTSYKPEPTTHLGASLAGGVIPVMDDLSRATVTATV